VEKEGIVNGKDVPNYGLSNYRKMEWLWKRLWPIMVIVVKKESAIRKKSNNLREEQNGKLKWREKGKSKRGDKVKEEKKWRAKRKRRVEKER
jgi:hypothetical protein